MDDERSGDAPASGASSPAPSPAVPDLPAADAATVLGGPAAPRPVPAVPTDAASPADPAAAAATVLRGPAAPQPMPAIPNDAPAPAVPIAEAATVVRASGPVLPGTLRPDRRIGRYAVLEELGRGGMGVVYRAFDTELRRPVALKLLLAGEQATAEERERFQREARAAARLSHANLVPVFDVGVHEELPYFTMELVDGTSLAQYLRRLGGRFPPAEAMRIVQEAALGLAYAHAQGVIHRDLKPENILLEFPPEGGPLPKLSDFGLARVVEGDAGAHRRTSAGVVLGTPMYMAPEQAAGEQESVDARSDVYSLGCVLYEMVTGAAPYPPGPPMAVLARKLSEDPPAPRAVNPALARDVETIVLTAIAREKPRRYADAAALAEDLARCRAGEAIRARPESRRVRLARWLRRRWAVAALAGALLFALPLAIVSSVRTRRLEAEAFAHWISTARSHLEAAILLRRSGGTLAESERRWLAPLEKAARAAIAADPRRPDPHEVLGRMYRLLGRPEEALREQERALALDPLHAPSRFERALLRVKRVHTRREASRRRQAGREEGAPFEAAEFDAAAATRWAIAAPEELAAESRDDLAQVRADRDVLVSGNATQVAPWMVPTLGVWLDVAGLERMPATAARQPAEVWAPIYLEAVAVRAVRLGHWENADQHCSTGLKADPEYTPLRLLRATTLAALAEGARAKGEDPEPLYARALAELERVVEREPDHAKAWLERGRIERARAVGRDVPGEDADSPFSRAVAHLTRAADLGAPAAEVRASRGRALADWARRRRDRGESAERLERRADKDLAAALGADPGLAEAWLARGRMRVEAALRTVGDPPAQVAAALDAAEADLHQAVALDPWLAEGWATRGFARGARAQRLPVGDAGADGLFERAVADLELGRRLDPAGVWSAVAFARVQIGRAAHAAAAGRDPTPALFHAKGVLQARDSIEAAELLAEVDAAAALHRRAAGGDARPLYAALVGNLSLALARAPDRPGLWLRSGLARRELAVADEPDRALAAERWLEALSDYVTALDLLRRAAETDRSIPVHAPAPDDFRGSGGRSAEAAFAAVAADAREAAALLAGRPEPWTCLGLAHAHLAHLRRSVRGSSAHDLREADAAFRIALAHFPGSAWLLRAAAAVAGEHARRQDPPGAEPGLWDAAEAAHDRAVAADTRSAQAWAGRARFRLARADEEQRRERAPIEWLTQAESDARTAVSLDPDDAEAWRRLADVRVRLAQAQGADGAQRTGEAALAACDAYVARRATWASAWALRGRVRGTLRLRRLPGQEPDADEFRRAEADFAHALTIDPGDAEIWHRRGHLRADWADLHRSLKTDTLAQWTAAADDFRTALQADPGSLEYAHDVCTARLAMLGFGSGSVEELSQIETEASRVLDDDPESGGARVLRGYVRLQVGSKLRAQGRDPAPALQGAEEDLAVAAGQYPENLWVIAMRASLFHELGRPADAAVALGSIIRRTPGPLPIEDQGLAEELIPLGMHGPAGRRASWFIGLQQGLRAADQAHWEEARDRLRNHLINLSRLLEAKTEAERVEAWKQPWLRDLAGEARFACGLALAQAIGPPFDSPARRGENEVFAAEAFVHLHEAVRLGWADADALRRPELAPLFGDARWPALIQAAEAAGK